MASKFKVGDRVRVIKQTMEDNVYEFCGNNARHKKGYIGIITSICEKSSLYDGCYWIRIDDNNDAIIDDLLELASTNWEAILNDNMGY